MTERFDDGEAFCGVPGAAKDVGVYETIYTGKLVDRLAHYEDCEENGELNKWIPCSERMPKGAVLCCDDRGNMLVGLLCKDEAGYMAYGDDGQEMYNCVAWMPLPEPYRGNK